MKINFTTDTNTITLANKYRVKEVKQEVKEQLTEQVIEKVFQYTTGVYTIECLKVDCWITTNAFGTVDGFITLYGYNCLYGFYKIYGFIDDYTNLKIDLLTVENYTL